MNPHHRAALVNGTLVLPDRVVTGSIVFEQGIIVDVIVNGYPALPPEAEVVDVDGAFVIPGLVDLHNDSLETEINPRPDANLPLRFALANMESRLLAAGVTTEFHAISFMDLIRSGRTVADATSRVRFIATLEDRSCSPVDHYVLHRLDVWHADGIEALFESIQDVDVRYLSINDHTPGQGQYRDLGLHVQRMTAWAESRGGVAPTEEGVRLEIETRSRDSETVAAVYRRVREEARRLGIAIATHDDDTAAKVDAQCAIGATVAEFPVTIEAARRARDRGMAIVVGAPNIVRGGSTSGNQDAADLFALGLADVICSDYHAPSLLPAALQLVADGLLDMPSAIRCLTLNPARAVRLEGVGAIAKGNAADLVVCRWEDRQVPRVECVIKRGQEVFRMVTSRHEAGMV